MQLFDLIVIGGGPAGYLAAERAAEGGLKTALFEKRALGGVCLNEGCIPSKAFLNSAKIFHYAQNGQKYGIQAENVTIDHAKVVKRKDKVVKILVSGVGSKLKHHEVSVFSETATLLGKEGDLFLVKAGEENYQAKKLLLCSGSTPIVPPIPGVKEGIDNGTVLTNREILSLTEAPASLVVIGGGVIGLEMANYFCDIGVEVSVVEMLDKIAGPTDVGISEILQKNLKKRGVQFHLGCKVTAVEGNNVQFEKEGNVQSIPAEKILLSIGRRAATEGLNLDALGVATERGAIITNEKMHTNVKNVYATGDVNGKSMLAHTAYRESEVAVNDMLGIEDTMCYKTIPSVIYTNPEVANVGYGLQEAKDAGFAAEEHSLPLRYSGRYLAEVEGGDGICKLVYDKERQVLLGVHIIGSYASEMIYGATMMIEKEIPIEELKKLVFPHPTVCEIIRETLFAL